MTQPPASCFRHFVRLLKLYNDKNAFLVWPYFHPVTGKNCRCILLQKLQIFVLFVTQGLSTSLAAPLSYGVWAFWLF